MANYNIPENPEFSVELRQLVTVDPAHADLFNEMFSRLLENDAALKGEKEPIVNAQSLEGKRADEFALSEHSHEPEEVGLGNVPNVDTNDQTPTYDVASEDAELTSGEKLSIAFGKIAKAIKSLISHLKDTTKHITSTERTNWGSAYSASHSHSNKSILDNTTASYTTAEQTKLANIAAGAQKNSITGVKGNAESSYRTGNVNLTPANIGAAAASHGNHVPTTQTADRATFLRNDNAWQKITPSDIGAAAASHNQAASTITAGTFAGKVQANATAAATVTNAQVRDIYAGTSDMTAGTTALTSGTIYIMYE